MDQHIVQTALREMGEEIGVLESSVRRNKLVHCSCLIIFIYSRVAGGWINDEKIAFSSVMLGAVVVVTSCGCRPDPVSFTYLCECSFFFSSVGAHVRLLLLLRLRLLLLHAAAAATAAGAAAGCRIASESANMLKSSRQSETVLGA